jgi:xanthine dehydrogenase molybdopterin-binding subunit B
LRSAILHPGMVEGQVRGGFAQALGAAVYEELAYGEDGAPTPFAPRGVKGEGLSRCRTTRSGISVAVGKR